MSIETLKEIVVCAYLPHSDNEKEEKVMHYPKTATVNF